LLRPTPAQEPANQATERQPAFGRKGDVGGHADNDAEHQTDHCADRDGRSNAHSRSRLCGKPLDKLEVLSASGGELTRSSCLRSIDRDRPARSADRLGTPSSTPLREAISIGAPKPGSEPEAPEFQDDWYGYVSKDLRDLLAANGAAGQPLGAYSRIYCGNGSLEACRSALQASLSEALAVTPAQIYGHGACAEDPQPSCFDMNRWTEASAVTVPPFPFQNRPTFQQVAEPTTALPR